MSPYLLLAPISLLYAVFFVVLLRVARAHRAYYALAKGVLSGLFIVAALAAFFIGPRGDAPGFAFLLAALVLCAGGDIMLGLANKSKKVRAKPFLAGALSFSLAHVVFCVLFYYRNPSLAWYWRLAPLALWAVIYLLEKRDAVRLKKMRPLAYVYTFLVGLMALQAVAIGLQAGLATPYGLLTALGGLLFLVSDVILLFLYFGTKRHRLFRGANLATYYIGMYLLAMSAHWY